MILPGLTPLAVHTPQIAKDSYYQTYSAAHSDGVVLYYPLNEGSGTTVKDRGSGNQAALTHNGMTWRTPTGEVGRRFLYGLDGNSAGYIQPVNDPTAVSRLFTMMLVIPNRGIADLSMFLNNLTGGANPYLLNKQNVINTGQQSLLAYNGPITTNTLSAWWGANTGAIATASADSTSLGVWYIFMSHDNATYRMQINFSSEATVSSSVGGTNTGALVLGGVYVSGNLNRRQLSMLEFCMWNRVLSIPEKNAIVTKQQLLVGEAFPL